MILTIKVYGINDSYSISFISPIWDGAFSGMYPRWDTTKVCIKICIKSTENEFDTFNSQQFGINLIIILCTKFTVVQIDH